MFVFICLLTADNLQHKLSELSISYDALLVLPPNLKQIPAHDDMMDMFYSLELTWSQWTDALNHNIVHRNIKVYSFLSSLLLSILSDITIVSGGSSSS